MDFKQQFQTLNSQQQSELVNVIQVSVGCNCDLDNFTEIAWGLIDNIAGFETATERQIRFLVYELYRRYSKYAN